MVLARVAGYFSSPAPSSPNAQVLQDEHDANVMSEAAVRESHATINQDQYQNQQQTTPTIMQEIKELEEDLDAARPPYIHAMLAGGLGGTMGDMLMHSLDTVKTRQQGDPHMPPKYTSMGSTYVTIFRQEGVRRGLYGGVTPAFLGSFSGTVLFFGSYEWFKRKMLDMGVTPSIAYLASGFLADLSASPLYVPSEVLKTRLQLQGRHNNPYFASGYNYRSTLDAFRTIIAREGLSELFSGYKATLARDLPFSALQFAFYEKEQKMAREWVGRKDIGLPLEILTGASAGGMAGVITCPLDVVKTRIQTQLDPALAHGHGAASRTKDAAAKTSSGVAVSPSSSTHRPTKTQAKPTADSKRPISTSGPSTALRQHGSVQLETESVIGGLKVIYQHEGIGGLFRGVGPRFVWTSVQSGTMLVMYQVLLKYFEMHPLVGRVDDVDSVA
ncbi:mitochondrial carrier domain-containing protein [Delphinella strobiligena]|nr:mitochondrial carrier domain-containing protein [Delphinella strobiligena]